MKAKLFFLVIILAVLCICSIAFAQEPPGHEEITLTTYYPAPYGEYNSLSVGDPGNGYLASVDGQLLVEGNVGIGTTAPVAKLETTLAASGHVPMLYSGNTWPQFPRTIQNVSASITTNDTTVATGPVIGLNLENSSQTNNTYSPLITFSRHSVTNDYNSIYASIGGICTGNGGDTNWTAGDLVFGTTNSNGPLERMRILANGNLGIGTTSPDMLLTVKSDNNNIGLDVSNYVDSTVMLIPNATNAPMLTSGGVAQNLVFGINSVEKMRIKTDGNVGIGTTSPGTNRLEVVGGPIKATGGLIIQTTVPLNPVTGQMWLEE